jgi:hypothetical protein
MLVTSNTSGNFIDLVKRITKFDTALKEHLGQVLKKRVARNHYKTCLFRSWQAILKVR